jgi:uncharacterized membrane protein HdeD (DUF308 family)
MEGVMYLDAQAMLINLSSNMPSLIKLATAIMYVLGTYIIVTSFAAMRHAPVIRQAENGQKSMFTLWKHVFVGSALIYFPSTIQATASTLFTDIAPYAYVLDSADSLKPLIDGAMSIVMLIGVIATGKGIYQLGFGQGHNSDNKGHIGPFSAGTVQILAGACLINLPTFLNVVFTTFGINSI